MPAPQFRIARGGPSAFALPTFRAAGIPPGAGSAVRFTDSLNYVTAAVGTALNSLSAITVEAYIYLPAIPVHNTGIVWQLNLGTPAGFGFFVNNSGQLNLRLANGTTSYYSSPLLLPLNKWLCVACTYSGTYLYVWANGARSIISSSASGSTTSTPTMNAYIGNYPPSTSNSTAMLIQEVRISSIDRSRSGQTVAPLFGPYAADANTLFLWHMNEGAGAICKDSGPNAVNATFGGSPLPTWGMGGF